MVEIPPECAAALVELRVPPFLYEWGTGRREIADSADRLRAWLASCDPQHPAVPELAAATRRIEDWLSRWPAHVHLHAYDAGPREWNEEITPVLQTSWARIHAQLGPASPPRVT